MPTKAHWAHLGVIDLAENQVFLTISAATQNGCYINYTVDLKFLSVIIVVGRDAAGNGPSFGIHHGSGASPSVLFKGYNLCGEWVISGVGVLLLCETGRTTRCADQNGQKQLTFHIPVPLVFGGEVTDPRRIQVLADLYSRQ